MKRKQFRKEIEGVINKHCIENNSNTPDFVLANYLIDCLQAFDKAIVSRNKWYNDEYSIKIK